MRKIKIAIPTDDGNTVRQRLRGARAFVVVTITGGAIIEEVLLWNLISEILTSPHGFFYNLEKCDVVIANGIDPCQRQVLKSLNVEIAETKESEVSMAISSYMKNMVWSGQQVEVL